ncbi:hypothetical protein BOTCAL_0295g00180 [Botryotinia calthae]|uniref:Uncharacterized protein n=1 Tax=Botryotinia calthae TaxID=38488 RepID=A0A4Y8CXA0_9HELO|nr:hypothetical protein BOTCAL_0295g00180 [Botryotinia calthae]
MPNSSDAYIMANTEITEWLACRSYILPLADQYEVMRKSWVRHPPGVSISGRHQTTILFWDFAFGHLGWGGWLDFDVPIEMVELVGRFSVVLGSGFGGVSDRSTRFGSGEIVITLLIECVYEYFGEHMNLNFRTYIFGK